MPDTNTDNFGKKLKNALGSETAGQIYGAVGNLMQSVPSLHKTKNTNDDIAALGQQTVANIASQFGPWGQLASAVYTGINKLGGATNASKGLGKVNDFANTAASILLPGAGFIVGKTDPFKMDSRIAQSSAFTGLSDNLQTTEGNASSKLLFGQNSANNMIAEGKLKQSKALGIMDSNDMAMSAANNPMNSIASQIQLSGGYNPLMSAKYGAKLQDVKRILALKESKKTTMYKQGGSFNVIPDGALHARKHHLEDLDEKYKEVTHKGIPIISESESGEITQHAEVEKEEIIFRLEVTKKIEELAKKGTDEAAIETGKLLVKEILYNTKDNTDKLI